jgi:flagellin-like protein
MKRVFISKVVVMKNAEMGVGTLIIFIAMLLVAAVAAGVLIQTAGSLQEKSLATGKQAENQIATNAETIEVSATDGRNSNLTEFAQLMKLAPGSAEIKLDQVIFTVNTKDKTSTLRYRGAGSICENNNIQGYNTWNEQLIDEDVGPIANYTLVEDLDDDRASDSVYVQTSGGVSYLTFVLSGAGEFNISLGTDISNAGAVPVTLDISDVVVANLTDTFAYVTVRGETDTDDTIVANMSFIVTPYKEGEGYFAAEYEQESTNSIEGNMQRGDIVMICYEAPREVNSDEEIRLNFIPKIGTPTLTQFTTPDVISTERVYLYP